MDWMLLGAAMGAGPAAPILAGFFDLLRSRKKPASPPPEKQPFPAMEVPAEGKPADAKAAGGAGRSRPPAPRIVKALGPPPPEARPLESELREPLPGAQPRVAKVASEEEEEEGELEDTAREAISSCKLMLASLEEGGMDVGVAARQLAKAESMFQQGLFEETVNYASKAMDIAEDLEADRDRCPKCHAETKPRWLLCPKCGQPLR